MVYHKHGVRKVPRELSLKGVVKDSKDSYSNLSVRSFQLLVVCLTKQTQLLVYLKNDKTLERDERNV